MGKIIVSKIVHCCKDKIVNSMKYLSYGLHITVAH